MFTFRFCESCLNSLITSRIPSATSESREGFNCPCCRAFNPAKNPARPQSEWASQFPTDFEFKKLISIRSENYLCPIHVSILCQYYCVDCSKILCHKCVILGPGPHKACQQVIALNDAAKERRIQLEQAMEQTRTHLGQATQSENSYVELKKVIANIRDTVATEIKTCASDLRQRVTEEENELLKQLNITCDSLIMEVNCKMLEVTIVKNEIQGCLRSYSHIHSSDVKIMLNNPAMDITRENTESVLSIAGEHLSRMTTRVNSVKITFQKARPPSPIMGSIAMSNDHQDISNQEFPRIPLAGPEHIQVLESIDINYVEYGARAHNFIVMAPSNIIIVIDPYKMCVRMFSSDRQSNVSLSLEGRPSGITQVSQSLVAVSLPNVQKNCFIKVKCMSASMCLCVCLLSVSVSPFTYVCHGNVCM